MHPQTATTSALATCAAQQQGKFWEYEKALWESAWDLDPPKLKGPQFLQEPHMIKLAEDLKLDVNKFKADMAGDQCKNHIANDQKQLAAVGARGTPAFFINGRFLSGAQPIERFKAIIDEELKKAEAAVKAGAKPETYYQEYVVAKGKKSVQ